MAFGVEFHKMVYGFEFSTIELCQVPSCGRNRQVFDFRPKFAQKGILGSNFIKLTDSNSAPSNYARYQVVAEIREGPLFLKVQGPTFLRVRVQGQGPVYKVCLLEEHLYVVYFEAISFLSVFISFRWNFVKV